MIAGLAGKNCFKIRVLTNPTSFVCHSAVGYGCYVDFRSIVKVNCEVKTFEGIENGKFVTVEDMQRLEFFKGNNNEFEGDG